MGKGDIKQQRMSMALVMRNPNHPYVKQGAAIFKVPVTTDKNEQSEILAKQIYDWLVYLSNKMDNYNKAIAMVQTWLKIFIQLDINRRPWVVKGADMAGEKFLLSVDSAKKKRQQEKEKLIKDKKEKGEQVVGLDLNSGFKLFGDKRI